MIESLVLETFQVVTGEGTCPWCVWKDEADWLSICKLTTEVVMSSKAAAVWKFSFLLTEHTI